MKKLLLLMLVLMGGVMQMSADIELYLHNSSNWTTAYPKFTNKGLNPDNTSETIWEYTLNTNTGLTDESDFYFRLKYSDYSNDLGPNWCKDSGHDYTFQWKSKVDNVDVYNGQWETYEIKHAVSDNNYNFWGGNSAFCIKHSTIKAKEYRITVYANRGNQYYVKVEIVSMPATVSNLGFSTFSCDRALDLDHLSTGLTAYYASSVTNGKVVLTKATGKVAASTGLLLAGTKGTVTTGTIPVVTTSEASAISTNLLKPSVTATEVAASTSGAYHYFLAGNAPENVGFYNLASPATSAAGKAYLETSTPLNGTQGSLARAEWIFQDNETTGIANVDFNANDNFDANAPMYNLAGQRVGKNYKGVVIVNGKKMLNK